jgi:hypothetical protein
MKLSELIADAKRTYEEFGDIPVVVPDSGCGCCSSGDKDAGTSVEKGELAIWTGRDYREESITYVVS